MKNKIISFLIVVIVLSIYPTWRYFEHSKIFASAVLEHVKGLGNWSSGSVSTSFEGEISLNNLSFTPKNYTQGFEIESVKIFVDPFFLLLTGSEKLKYMLPESMSISVNGALLNFKDDDLSVALRDDSLWMLMAGYGGSFGCQREFYTSFDDASWKKILSSDQLFNVDLYYSRQQNSSIDVDLILDAENLFSSTWSSNLKSSYNDEQIIVDELIVDKLYYNFLDNGFNLIRNNACKENYQSSFSTYRLSSAEHVQKYLRTYFSKELPVVMLNWYQRMLVPDVEYNTIITLNDRKFINEIYRIDQRVLFENSLVEIATTGNDYLPITLQNIDYTNIDPELLRKENLKREQHKKQEARVKLTGGREKYKPTVFTTGKFNKNNSIALNKIASVLNKKIRIKTKKGRPITGVLRKVNSETILIESRYKTGSAKLTISINKITTVSVVR